MVWGDLRGWVVGVMVRLVPGGQLNMKLFSRKLIFILTYPITFAFKSSTPTTPAMFYICSSSALERLLSLAESATSSAKREALAFSIQALLLSLPSACQDACQAACAPETNINEPMLKNEKIAITVALVVFSVSIGLLIRFLVEAEQDMMRRSKKRREDMSDGKDK